MKESSANRTRPQTTAPRQQPGGVRMIIFALIFFLLGLAVGAFWQRPGRDDSPSGPGTVASARRPYLGESGLSDSTRAVLERLDSPVEIRFYGLLDHASVSDSTRAFAGRVERLLSAYQRESDGRINVIRYTSVSDANIEAASADGIRPFNLERGAACFLGIALAQDDRRESLPRLFPEWEEALESDVARAIVRLMDARAQARRIASPAQADAIVIEEVKRAIPNLATVSFEEGTRILRETALAEFRAVTAEMETKLRQAQEHFSRAQQSNSEADQQAALKQLQQIQAEQTARLKAIADRLQARITAFEQLKNKN